MRGTVWATILAVGILLPAAGARAAEQEAINRAIELGVASLKQFQGRDGKWPHAQIGATALAGLTLLECKVPANDPAVEKAAAAVRRESIKLDYTYSISLCLLFLDRLGDARDVPLIESLAVRLLAGQAPSGNWSYFCPPIGAAEVQRLSTLLRQHNELKTARELPKPGKRTARDLPREIQQQLALIGRAQLGRGMPGFGAGDNSNTQFATLALWVAHRHGLPVGAALRRTEAHFRLAQQLDGGWSYTGGRAPPLPRGAPPGMVMPGMGSTAAMTCAGLLGLAVGHGVRGDHNAAKDRSLKVGLLALGTAIGTQPQQARPRPGPGAFPGPRPFPGRGPGGPPHLGQGNGKVYYFLWSLERVAVALNLKTIGKKDWYNWGADILLANQMRDGAWRGEYGDAGVDTCFALLFLKRANLATDLTATLGKLSDPAMAELRPIIGGSGPGGRRKGLRHALTPEDKDSASADKRPKEGGKLKPIPDEIENAKAGKLSDALVQATGNEQDAVLKRLRDTKGVDYTEALLLAIPRLDDAARKKARTALKDRFRRLTAKSLLNYMKDTDPEVRQAAVLAAAERDMRQYIPVIISKLSDPEPAVVRAAHVALKALTEKDFGPAADATPEETEKAIAAWKAWWRKNGK